MSDYCPSLAKFYHNIVPHAKPLAFEALHPGPSAHLHHLLPEIDEIKILGYHSVLIIPEMNVIIQKVNQALCPVKNMRPQQYARVSKMLIYLHILIGFWL